MNRDNASCNLCEGTDFRMIEDDEPPFKVLQCKRCSLVFVNPFPNGTGLEDHYDQNYYHEWIEAQKQQRIKMWARRLVKIETLRPAGRLLDIGCGEGSFLELAHSKGWQIAGTELSQFAADYASTRLGVKICRGEIFDANYSDSTFDVVTIWHVLEHVRDPGSYLREIRRVLKPSGLLILAVPNVNNCGMQTAYRLIKGRKLKLFSKQEKELHLYHFSTNTITDYLRHTGFRCLRLGPDFGIVEPSKRVVNFLSAIPYYLFGAKIFNAIEVIAAADK